MGNTWWHLSQIALGHGRGQLVSLDSIAPACSRNHKASSSCSHWSSTPCQAECTSNIKHWRHTWPKKCCKVTNVPRTKRMGVILCRMFAAVHLNKLPFSSRWQHVDTAMFWRTILILCLFCSSKKIIQSESVPSSKIIFCNYDAVESIGYQSLKRHSLLV